MKTLFTMILAAFLHINFVQGAPQKNIECARLEACSTCTTIGKTVCGWQGELSNIGKCEPILRNTKSVPNELAVKTADCPTRSATPDGGVTTATLDQAIGQAWTAVRPGLKTSRRQHVLFGEQEKKTSGRYLFSIWDKDNDTPSNQLIISTATSVGRLDLAVTTQEKSFWIDTAIEGQIFENQFQIGEFDGLFGNSNFNAHDRTESSDHPFIAQMCKAAIRAAVVTKRVQPQDVVSKPEKWTNTDLGVSFAVASPVHAGQNLCVTVTTASCFPGSIHPTTARPGQPCFPKELDDAAEPKKSGKKASKRSKILR